jgi:outer membrane protein assembly factor BamB
MMQMKWSAAVVASVMWMSLGMLILAGCQNTATDGQTANSSTESEAPDDEAQPGDEIEDDEAASDDETGDDETGDDDAIPDDEATPDDETPDDEATAGEETGESSNVPTRNPVIVAGDWSQWGGNSLRNNVPIGKGIPIEWEVGKFDRKTRAWDPSSALNIKWVARVGSQTYGNPVIAGGRLFVGTNNSAGYLQRYGARVDLGCLICFEEATGKFLWQHSSEKLPTGRVHDWPLQGICCAPLVEGNRLWFVGSRGEVICLDAEGYYDGEDDGAVKNELARLFDMRQGPDPKTDTVAPAIAALKEGKLTEAVLKAFASAGMELPAEVMVTGADSGKQWNVQAMVGNSDRELVIKLQGPKLSAFKVVTPDDKNEADVVWKFDMMKNLKVSQHNMCSCSVTSFGDVLFVNTSNGLDESHINLPQPAAPSFIAMNKNTGEVYWTDKSPGANILHGQWSSPTVGILGDVPQVIFAGGDGWVYSFGADQGKDGSPTLLWKFDANPKTSVWRLGGRGTRNNIIATPVIHEGRVYVAVGQDPEHGEGEGHLWCLDPTKRGDVSRQLAVDVKTGKPLPPARLQAVIEEDGQTARDNQNSAVIWHYSHYDQDDNGEIDFEEQMHRSCGTVAIKNNLLYISDFSGLFHCLDAKTGSVHWTYDMLAAAWGSPLIVEDHVYIGDEDGDVCVFNLSKEKHDPIAEINMGNSVYSTPVVANDVLYIANKTHVFAIAVPKKE